MNGSVGSDRHNLAKAAKPALPNTATTQAAATRVVTRLCPDDAEEVLAALGLVGDTGQRCCPQCGEPYARGVHGMSGDARCQRSACLAERRKQKTRPVSTP